MIISLQKKIKKEIKETLLRVSIKDTDIVLVSLLPTFEECSAMLCV